MESTAEIVKKLKRRLKIEISFKEINPSYQNVYNKLKNVRINGFRSGKFPKGWLDKRFQKAMHQEAIENILPKCHIYR